MTMSTDAQHRPQGAMLGDAAGVGNATSGSITDRLTREHRMTLDEARLILNAKRDEAMEHVLRVRTFVCFQVYLIAYYFAEL